MNYVKSGDVINMLWVFLMSVVGAVALLCTVVHLANQRLAKDKKRPGLRIRFHARMAAWHTAKAEAGIICQSRDEAYQATWAARIDSDVPEPKMWGAN